MNEKAAMNLPEFARKLGISKSLAYKMAADGRFQLSGWDKKE